MSPQVSLLAFMSPMIIKGLGSWLASSIRLRVVIVSVGDIYKLHIVYSLFNLILTASASKFVLRGMTRCGVPRFINVIIPRGGLVPGW